ncbi:MAG: hypothetical protein EZS28_023693, partial [Streblomastix strix]
RVYEYILNWIAWMIQNPGKKSRAAIILQGRQGIGKNRFTDVIAELTNRYSCPNITNIDEFTGKFNSVVENKMFSVLIEAMNYNDSKKGVATIMKSIISDQTIRINEKNQSRRIAVNVMNVMNVTNSDMTIQPETDDRRHLVCACKTVHQVTEEHPEQTEYLRTQVKFKASLIPMTEAKKQLINVSRSPADDVIIEHFEQFKQGILVSVANQYKPQNWILKTYKNALEHKCLESRPYFNKIRTRIYVLKEDQIRYYKLMMSEEDIETSLAKYKRYKQANDADGHVNEKDNENDNEKKD